MRSSEIENCSVASPGRRVAARLGRRAGRHRGDRDPDQPVPQRRRLPGGQHDPGLRLEQPQRRQRLDVVGVGDRDQRLVAGRGRLDPRQRHRHLGPPVRLDQERGVRGDARARRPASRRPARAARRRRAGARRPPPARSVEFEPAVVVALPAGDVRLARTGAGRTSPGSARPPRARPRPAAAYVSSDQVWVSIDSDGTRGRSRCDHLDQVVAGHLDPVLAGHQQQVPEAAPGQQRAPPAPPRPRSASAGRSAGPWRTRSTCSWTGTRSTRTAGRRAGPPGRTGAA